ncbi:MAG: Lrp/AsnC family transcriptional regulator [Rhodobiaceae bacterium]|nr:Lrp/AsnC family transcriptional regulator [Rhodobiaceae bacterium]
MTDQTAKPGTDAAIDETDRAILRILQADATLSLERIARKAGLSKTAVWNRIQRMQQNRVILRNAAIVDPRKVGLSETFFIAIKTSAHDAEWLEKFYAAVQEIPEIVEAHRLAGEIDYLLKVQVASTRHFDDFYRALVKRISIYSVTSSLSMQTLKHQTALPI